MRRWERLYNSRKGLPTETTVFDTSLCCCEVLDDLMNEVDKSSWVSELYIHGRLSPPEPLSYIVAAEAVYHSQATATVPLPGLVRLPPRSGCGPASRDTVVLG